MKILNQQEAEDYFNIPLIKGLLKQIPETDWKIKNDMLTYLYINNILALKYVTQDSRTNFYQFQDYLGNLYNYDAEKQSLYEIDGILNILVLNRTFILLHDFPYERSKESI